MPPSREPWIKLKVRTDESDKIASLPNDQARWGWIRVLLKAKTQRRMGIFASRGHLRTVIAPHGRFIDAWIEANLLHQWPTPCLRCTSLYDSLASDGEFVVHDYLREQRDPTNADRQADWRHSRSDAAPGTGDGGPDRNAGRNGTANGDRDGGDNAERNGPRNALGDGAVPPTVTADSRARGTTATETETRDSESEEKREKDSLAAPQPRQRARAPGVAGIHRTNGEDQEAKVARLRAKLADPATSAEVRKSAIAELGRLGVPLDAEPGEALDFGDGSAP